MSATTSLTSPGTGPTSATGRQVAAEIAYASRVMRTPSIAASWAALAQQARAQGWSHEEYLAAVLARQVADREANSIALRTAGAHFPAAKTLTDFNADHQPSLRRDVLGHLATSAWVARAENVVLLGPPGTGKTHLGIGLGVAAVHAGHKVLFDSATGWIRRLSEAHRGGHAALDAELRRLGKYKLLIIDEVGYIPIGPHAANLFFQLIAARYETGSVLITSNLPFKRWGEIFGDEVIAAAMIDRLVHHAEVIALSGESYRTRARRAALAADPAVGVRAVPAAAPPSGVGGVNEPVAASGAPGGGSTPVVGGSTGPVADGHPVRGREHEHQYD